MAIPQKPVQLSVGTSRVKVPFNETDNPRGFQLLADPDNTGKLYHGGDDVTTANGFLLPAGGSYYFEAGKIGQVGGTVYLIADTANQKAYADPQ